MGLLLSTNWDIFVEWLYEFAAGRPSRIVLILFICIIILAGVKFITKAVLRIINNSSDGMNSDVERRAKTLGSVMKHAAKILVATFFVLAMLNEFGVSIGPLLAGASIAGVAIGFGAQTLVKDAISGFFLLLENQYDVGDIINIDEKHVGVVERVTLRITLLRDLEGRAHYIPNGSIDRVIVLSKDFSRAMVDLEVGHDQDVDRTMQMLREIGLEMHNDMPDVVLEPLETMGVNEITHTGYVIRTLTKTARGNQWSVGRELRRRILIRFQAEGIKVPVPKREIWNTNSSSK